MEPEVERQILQEARAEIGYADHKASLVLASLGIGFGALLGGLLAGDWSPSELESWGQASWWLGAVSATVAVAVAASAVWPRYRKPKHVDKVHYWGHVASFESVEALAEHLENHPVEAGERTRHQMWELSQIVSRKYALVRGAFVFAAIAVGLFLISAASGP